MSNCGCTVSSYNNEESPRTKHTFDFDWRFFKGDVKDAEGISFSDTDWRNLNLPHDWSVEGPFDKDNPAGGDGAYLPAGTGWYRKHFNVSEELSDKKIFIEFDGVYRVSDVWINGKHLGKKRNGYTSFYYDITEYLNYGKDNIIAVRVDNSEQPNSRWYSGSGIYRHTWLVITDKVYVPIYGTYITTPEVSRECAMVDIRVKINNENSAQTDIKLINRIFDKDNNLTGSTEQKYTIDKKSSKEILQVIVVNNPNLWSIENPYLYKVETNIEQNNEIIDSIITYIGIRKIEFDNNRGFLLNDINLKIKGVCLHHDGGAVGAAVPERVIERRLELLKEMGCNGIRMSHNPPSPELLDMCDRMGFVVMDEAFDEWTVCKMKNIIDTMAGKTTKQYGYSQFFDEDAADDLKAMLHRDRNHPSIVLWSVGNEIPEQTHSNGHELLKKLVDICHEEDPTRPVTSACDNIKAEPREATYEFLELLDVVGYNYVDRWRTRTETYYAEDHYNHPHWKMIGSENRSINGARGEYSFKTQEFGWWRGPYNTSMVRAEQLWKFTKMHDYVAGDFMWTGIDYLGESHWPSKNASCGPLDMCGFKKDAFYFYQSQWTEKPMLHVFPHWNWEGMEGQVIPVLCYTNCDSVELFVNGRSFGAKSYELPSQGMTEKYGHFDKPVIHATTADLHLSWDVPYERGVLKVVGKKDGEVVCVKETVTTGKPSRIKITADRENICADGKDVSHIIIEVIDDEGNMVPTADNLISLEIEGHGNLIGFDNGNPASHEDFKYNHRRTFNGLCLAIIQSSFEKGKITVKATSDGLASDTVILSSK